MPVSRLLKFGLLKFGLLIFGLSSVALADSLDHFPLNPGAQYVYAYDKTFETSVFGYGRQRDSGTVHYIIRDSIHVEGSYIRWSVEQRVRVRRWTSGSLFPDTSYLFENTSTVSLSESMSENHELTISSLVWSFPHLVGGELTPVHRYAVDTIVQVAGWDWVCPGTFEAMFDSMTFSTAAGMTYRHWNECQDYDMMTTTDSGTASLISFTTDVAYGSSFYGPDIPLVRNYPNPFNPVTTIELRTSAPGRLDVAIYDLRGQVVAKLVDEFRDAGVHRVTFDAGDLSAGIYFAMARGKDFVGYSKLILLK
jgi:hypothetical protein